MLLLMLKRKKFHATTNRDGIKIPKESLVKSVCAGLGSLWQKYVNQNAHCFK